ncbi:MAG TPA: DUF1292 domain-containing protein [Bacillota bacterium]|nr:DUF1292 domain-containing protein [Bacillota bacterium]
MAEQDNIVTLTDEDGQDHDFEVIDVIKVDEGEYAILRPMDDEEDEAIILKVDTDEDGNEILLDIEDDDEWEKVADAWQESLEDEEE